jgi:hypothetical protein
MGKRTRADSARKSNLVKANQKKRKINDGNEGNVSTYNHGQNIYSIKQQGDPAQACDSIASNEIEDCHPPTPLFLDSQEAFEFNGESENSADENEEAQSSTFDGELRDGHKRLPPTIPACQEALLDVIEILNPQRKNGIGHLTFDGDDVLRKHLEMMRMFLWMYVDQKQPRTWTEACDDTVHAHQKGSHTRRRLRQWTRSFVEDCKNLPINLYGSWNVSLLDTGDLAKDIHEHLQSVGKYVGAQDIVDYLAQSEVQQKHGLKKSISLATAQRWMHMMDYRWTKMPSGQYIDGHE